MPGGEGRGGHAHRRLEQIIIAATGSFTVSVDNGRERQKYFLNRSYYGLYIPSMIWRDIDNFSSASVCLVIASKPYDEADYIRDYRKFKATVHGTI